MKGVFLEAELLNSEAFRGLSRWSFLVYLRFLQKRVMVKEKHKSRTPSYRIENNGEIIFPYREAVALGIDERAFRNAIDELISKGFIEIARPGKGGRSGEATLYFIDTRWRKYGSDQFKPPKNPRIKATIQGRGWAAYNARKKLKHADKNDSESTDKIAKSFTKNDTKRLTKLPAAKKEKITTTHCISAKIAASPK